MKTALTGLWAVALLTGCDSLVGGKCAPGYVATDDGSLREPRATRAARTRGTVEASASGAGEGGGGSAGGGSSGGPSTGADCGRRRNRERAVGGRGWQRLPPLPRRARPSHAYLPSRSAAALARTSRVDPQNCGACGVACDDGASCSEGVCGGAVAGNGGGHAVVVGMNFAHVELGDPEAVVLGNAVFLAQHDPVRVLEYVGDASDEGSVGTVDELVFDQSVVRGRTVETFVAKTAVEVPADLASEGFDVLLVHDQDRATAKELAALGASWAPSLDAFATGGGVVVVLATSEGHNAMPRFIQASNLLPVTKAKDVTGQMLAMLGDAYLIARGVFGKLHVAPAHGLVLDGRGRGRLREGGRGREAGARRDASDLRRTVNPGERTASTHHGERSCDPIFGAGWLKSCPGMRTAGHPYALVADDPAEGIVGADPSRDLTEALRWWVKPHPRPFPACGRVRGRGDWA